MSLTAAARASARRPLFRRGQSYVFVKPVRLTADRVAQPGEAVDPGMFRQFHLRNLYRRRLIGVLGDAWTQLMLGVMGQRLEREAERAEEAGADTDTLLQRMEQVEEAQAEGEAVQADEAPENDGDDTDDAE